MKTYLRYFVVAFLLFTSMNVSAQQTFTISGTVTDSIGMPQKGATVFISGTKKITGTNDKGEFKFDLMPAGTFQLSVSMLGFAPYAQNVTISKSSFKADVVLKGKAVILREVVIGGVDNRPLYMNIFRMAFLGSTVNAKACVLLNPDAISFNFSKKTGILTVDVDGLLLIESKNLGYKISYLLKNFTYNTNLRTVLYNGEPAFEELPGTDSQKQLWTKNRLETYHGSMMHFLRSLYQREPERQGFAIYNLYGLNPDITRRFSNSEVEIDAAPVDINKLISRADSSIAELKFQVLYVDYLGENGLKLKKNAKRLKQKIEPSEHSSILKLVAPPAIIDARGSCSDYRAFYLQGDMSEKRVGDQLPFEYQPDK